MFQKAIAFRIGLMLGIGMAVSGSEPARADEQQLDPSLQRVLRAYRSRADQLNPVFVRYRLTRSESGDWVKAMDAHQGNKAPAAARELTDEVEYARKGDKIWQRARRISPTSGRSWDREDFVLFNGRHSVRKTNRENQYVISKTLEDRWAAQLPLYFCRESAVMQMLQEWADGKTATAAAVSQSTEEGQPVLIADVRYPKTKWANKIWLLPLRDYGVRRFEVFDPANKLVNRVEVSDYRDVNGTPFPSKASETHYMGSGRLGYTATYEVLSVETDSGQVPDSLFHFEFPPGSEVHDADSGTVVRQTELAESRLNEAVQELAPPSLWRRWWVVGAVIVVFIGSAVLLVRWHRRVRVPAPV